MMLSSVFDHVEQANLIINYLWLASVKTFIGVDADEENKLSKSESQKHFLLPMTNKFLNLLLAQGLELNFLVTSQLRVMKEGGGGQKLKKSWTNCCWGRIHIFSWKIYRRFSGKVFQKARVSRKIFYCTGGGPKILKNCVNLWGGGITQGLLGLIDWYNNLTKMKKN